ncbi:MAG: hypothetical protein HZC43_12855 [Nitrosomonadales bacterium]|nr:hypothetical protein [Nitrosomonadales bacterium]
MKKIIAGNRNFVLLLTALVAVVYGPFLFNPLVFDDTNLFAPGSDDVNRLGAFSPLQIRWLPYATMAWTVGAADGNLFWLRLEALMLHASVGLALFFLLLRLYQLVPISGCGGKEARQLAFCSASLFVLHPVAVYGAGYLIQRTIVMAALFSLLALLAYMRGLTGNRGAWLWASVLFYGLAVLSKEHAIMLPAVMLALTVLLSGVSASLFWRLRWIYLACLSIALLVVFQKLGIIGNVYEFNARGMLEKIEVEHAYPLSALTQCALFFKYVGLWLLPNPAWMSVDMREPFATGFLSVFGLAALAFAGYGMTAVWLLFRRGAMGVAGFALLFPWLLFFTEFSTVRIQESFVLYRSYLWMMGIFIALPLLLGRIKAGIAMPVMLLMILVLGMGSVNRLTTFSDSLLLWHDAAILVEQKHGLPGVWRIYENRAISFLNVKRPQQAIQDYRLALSLSPRSGQKYLYQGLGAAYIQESKYTDAVSSFGSALELDSGYDHARFSRGVAYMMMGNLDSARADLAAVCKAGRRIACDKLEAFGEK